MTLITSVETREINSGEILAVEIEIDSPVTSVEMQELGAPTTEITFVGLQGPPGPGIEPYTHTQALADLVWTINHNLGFYPSVELFDPGGQEYDAEILHTSINQTVVTHVIPTYGSARLL